MLEKEKNEEIALEYILRTKLHKELDNNVISYVDLTKDFKELILLGTSYTDLKIEYSIEPHSYSEFHAKSINLQICVEVAPEMFECMFEKEYKIRFNYELSSISVIINYFKNQIILDYLNENRFTDIMIKNLFKRKILLFMDNESLSVYLNDTIKQPILLHQTLESLAIGVRSRNIIIPTTNTVVMNLATVLNGYNVIVYNNEFKYSTSYTKTIIDEIMKSKTTYYDRNFQSYSLFKNMISKFKADINLPNNELQEMQIFELEINRLIKLNERNLNNDN